MDTHERPLCVDLYTGLHGWGEGFLAEGYRVIGVDLLDMRKELGQEPLEGVELLLADVLTLNGAQFKDATVIVASPPCTEPSYRAMPWKRAKALNALGPPYKFINLFNACFRIREEASEAAGRRIPLIVENVVGAQRWVGRAGWHFGSYYLWGDIPALMPIPRSRGASKNTGFRFDGSGKSFQSESGKNAGQDWSRFAKTGEVSPHWRMEATKVPSSQGRRTDVGKGARFTSRDCGLEGIKQHGSGREWFAGEGKISRETSSNSAKRKAASAQIAKIPFPLANYIAKHFRQCYDLQRESDTGPNGTEVQSLDGGS